MPENLMDSQGATVLTAVIVVAIALLALVGVFWLIRNRAASTFIRGGKNRQPRLAVLDATAVDTRRRLVLIRRDDVEHLVMIGGPTDIVIESGIPQTQTGRRQQQPDRSTPNPPQQQRPAHAAPAARTAAPLAPKSPPSPPDEPATTPSGRAPTRADTGPGPAAPRQPQAAAPAPTIVAAAATVAATRTEAADLLETARNRVFEEPEFDATELEELIAVQHPAAQPEPPRPAPANSLASAPSNQNEAEAAATDPLQAEAADVLETVRTRMFEEPTFDGDAFDELTADTPADESSAPEMRPAPAPATPAAPSPAQAATPASAQASSDFEAVLAAELSEDPTLGSPRDSLISAQYHEHQLAADDDDRVEAPEVKPEPQQSRDSLEEEMEKLLGDLSRK